MACGACCTASLSQMRTITEDKLMYVQTGLGRRKRRGFGDLNCPGDPGCPGYVAPTSTGGGFYTCPNGATVGDASQCAAAATGTPALTCPTGSYPTSAGVCATGFTAWFNANSTTVLAVAVGALILMTFARGR